MTTNTPAPAQEAVQIALEAYAAYYDQTERLQKDEGCLPAVSPAFVATDIRTNMVNAVVQALSKLRAPVAEERAAFDPLDPSDDDGAPVPNVTELGDLLKEKGVTPGAAHQIAKVIHMAGWCGKFLPMNSSVLGSSTADEDGLTKKQTWWTGYRAGKGLDPSTHRRAALASAPAADERAAQEYGSPADVAQRIEQYLAHDGRMNSGTQLLYEAMKALRGIARGSK